MAESTAEEAVDCALRHGATYADSRVQFEESTGFIVDQGLLQDAGSISLSGVGLRVVAEGAWGFCSIDNASSKPKKLNEVAERAVRLASGSAKGIVSPVDMAWTKPTRARVTPIGNGFDRVKAFDLESAVRLARDCDQRVRSVGSEIRDFSFSFALAGFIETFASSEGACITQSYSGYLGSIFIVASSLGTTQYYPRDIGGFGDYNDFLNNKVAPLAEKTAQKALQLARSRSLNSSETYKTVVLDPDFTALLVHESIGHPLEADRVLGGRGDPNNAPWTFAAFGKKVAGDFLNIVDDAKIETPAWYRYDNEGVEAKRKVLISRGVIRECIHSRETAKAFEVEPNGGARSPSYHFIPMPRMSNTYIESDDWAPEEIIRDTKDGIYVVGGLTPAVDSRAHRWSISAKEAYLIAEGETKEMLRGIVISEVTPDFLGSLDAIGKDLRITVIPDCAKGSPVQTLPVGNGGPTIRGKAYVSGVA